jgi:hypothetical protein
MSYLDRLPVYAYELPCGHSFASLTPSLPDDRDGRHWFWCRVCDEYSGTPDRLLVELPPRHPSGIRMSDNQLVVRINAALEKDRVRAHYLSYWDALSIRGVSALLGVQRDAVAAVASDLGVYRDE